MSRWEVAASPRRPDGALVTARGIFRDFVGLVDPRGRESRRGTALILAWCITLPLTLVELGRMLTEVNRDLMTLGTSPVAAILFSVNTLVALTCIVIAVMTLVRRLHDRCMAWTSLLVALIPYVGWGLVIFHLCGSGDAGPNVFGPDPREASPAG